MIPAIVAFVFFDVFLFVVAGWLYGIIATVAICAILALVFILWNKKPEGKPTIIVSRIVVVLAFFLILISIVMIADTYINGSSYYNESFRSCAYCNGRGCKRCDGFGGVIDLDKRYNATEIGYNGWLLFFESAMLMCGMIACMANEVETIFTIFNPIHEKQQLFKKVFIGAFSLLFIIGFVDIFGSTNGFQEIYCGMLQGIVGNEPYTSAYSATFFWIVFSFLGGGALGGIVA